MAQKIATKAIKTQAQLDAALKFFKPLKDQDFDPAAFDIECGVGILISLAVFLEYPSCRCVVAAQGSRLPLNKSEQLLQ